MNAQDLVLNIAVNLGRLSRWADEGKTSRIDFFLDETEGYLKQLENTPKDKKFIPTLLNFKNKFYELKKNKSFNEIWAEDALTWANILTHRAKLA